MRQPSGTESSFSVTWNIVFPLLVFAWMFFIGMHAVDYWCAHLFYLGEKQWIAGHGFIPEELIHHRGKLLPKIFGIGALVLLILSFVPPVAKRFPKIRTERLASFYVFASIGICSLVVSAFKHTSSRRCPWDLPDFGAAVLGSEGCFPAGHASAGFSLVCLYFLARHYRFRHTNAVLAATLAAGIVFALTRQLQGAHFLSHSIATAAVCWAICAALYRVTIGRNERRPSGPLP